MKQHKFKHVIWDWNGTIIDDMPLAVDVVNSMLGKRSMRLITKEEYMALFDHPVSDFYKTIGFNLNHIPYEEITLEFGRGYNAGFNSCKLQAGAKEALSAFQAQDITQSILSASHRDPLERAIRALGVAEYFHSLVGLDNYLAHSKVEQGLQHIQTLAYQPHEILLIGDTTHDFAVAQAIGCACVLVASGHQNADRLQKTGAVVLNSLEEYFA